jgi:hypothetical protein
VKRRDLRQRPDARTALRIDLAGGARSIGFYLGSGEAF